MKRIIRCVVLYYEKGKSGKDYVEKENYRLFVDDNITKLSDLEAAVR